MSSRVWISRAMLLAFLLPCASLKAG